jgi:hypothetical protein
MFSGIFGVCAVILGGLYWARVDSIMNMQAHYEESQPKADHSIMIYDVGCLRGPFSDPEKARQIKEDNKDNDCDEDCQKLGTQWSTAFMLNAIVMTLLTLNFLCTCISLKSTVFRFTASICACAICCFHIATILTTAVFRFRPQG